MEEIQCEEEPYDEKDKKYMQEAIDLWEKSQDKKYNGMYRIIIIPQKAQKLHVCNIILIYIVQVGSVLVHPQNGVIGRGYNRMPLCRGQELDLPMDIWMKIKVH